MRRTADCSTYLINLGHGEKFGQRWTRHAMRTIIGNARFFHLLHRRLHIFVILIVHAGGQTGFGHFRKALCQKRRIDTRKALGISAKGREFNRCHTGFRLFGNTFGTFKRVNRAIEREIDKSLFSGMGDFAFHGRCRTD